MVGAESAVPTVSVNEPLRLLLVAVGVMEVTPDASDPNDVVPSGAVRFDTRKLYEPIEFSQNMVIEPGAVIGSAVYRASDALYIFCPDAGTRVAVTLYALTTIVRACPKLADPQAGIVSVPVLDSMTMLLAHVSVAEPLTTWSGLMIPPAGVNAPIVFRVEFTVVGTFVVTVVSPASSVWTFVARLST